MPKQAKMRCVKSPPGVLCFKPQGVPIRMVDKIILTVGEYEALRLGDRDGLDHGAAAAKLGISRATCARMMESAHYKVADALSNGKAIMIEGGEFRLCMNRYRCSNCGLLWESRFNAKNKPIEMTCDACGSTDVVDVGAELGWHPGKGCGGKGKGRGRCGENNQ